MWLSLRVALFIPAKRRVKRMHGLNRGITLGMASKFAAPELPELRELFPKIKVKSNQGDDLEQPECGTKSTNQIDVTVVSRDCQKL